MSCVTLKAHYNGQQIVLDEPFEIPQDADLLVTVLSSPGHDAISEQEWCKAAAAGEAFEFLENPAEDIYTIEDGEPFDSKK